MKLLAVVVVVACGPGLVAQAPDTKLEGRNALLEASGDAKAIEELFRGAVTNGGLWFDDAACAAKFANGSVIASGELDLFAHCLATLKLRQSTRADALGDVVVMSYAPGIEIEARVVSEGSGPHLTWIGYESRRAVDALIPTVTAEALESIRLTGERNGPIDHDAAVAMAVGPGAEPANAWLRVCVDETGTVTLAHPFTTSDPRAAAVFEKTAMAWTFKPFMVGARVVPVCSMIHMTYPTGGAAESETLPLPPPTTDSGIEAITLVAPTKLEPIRISGNKMITPEDAIKTVIQRNHVGKVVGSFRVCLDEKGAIESTLPMRSTGYASYDRRIIGMIDHTWKYAPYLVDGKSTPVCTRITFIYSQQR